MAVRVDLLISLDGFATTTDQTPDSPFGNDWSRLVGAYVATKTFQERVLKDTSGKGTTGVDDAYAKTYFENIGGGPTVVRDYLKAGLVDHLHVAVAPILLGRGIRLWDELRGLEAGYAVRSETAESGTIHITFERPVRGH
jgi:dihydrofolate reductase